MPLPKNRKEYIQGFLNQIRPQKLKPAVAEIVTSIAAQFKERGDISDRQYVLLRNCSLATTENRTTLNNRWQVYYQAYRG